MASYLLLVAGFVVASMIAGFARILWGPSATDRMMAIQLAGTGGIAILLLGAVATETASAVDAAMLLALLAAFVSVVFVRDLPIGKKATRKQGS